MSKTKANTKKTKTTATNIMSLHDQIRQMVYAHGGEGETPKETLVAIEAKVREYVMCLTCRISEIAEYKGAMDDESIKFALGRDRAKLNEVILMSRSYEKIHKESSLRPCLE